MILQQLDDSEASLSHYFLLQTALFMILLKSAEAGKLLYNRALFAPMNRNVNVRYNIVGLWGVDVLIHQTC